MANPNLANIVYSYSKSIPIVGNTFPKLALNNPRDSNLLIKVNSIIGFNSSSSLDGRLIINYYQDESKLLSNIVNTVIPFNSNITTILPSSIGLILSENDYIGTFANINDSINLIINYDEMSEVLPRNQVEYLVVAGGGGGGRYNGGGGGGGGLLTGAFYISPSTNYCVAIGSGGAGADNGGSANGKQGGNSCFANVVSIGGGGGGGAYGTSWPKGQDGGSGGGGQNAAAFGFGNPSNVASHWGGNGVPGQGNPGGFKHNLDGDPCNLTFLSPGVAGGGGGAGSIGFRPYQVENCSSGRGGIGCLLGTNGLFCYFAGGGGGYGASGGLGGGGPTHTAGGTNTGGGAGGAPPAETGGQPGGSGIVMIAVCNCLPDIACASAGLTYTIDRTMRPGYKVYTFTAGTGTVCW